LSAKMLYIIAQSFEVGGGLDYSERSSKSKDAEDETVVNSSSDYVLRLQAIYNFGNLDTDTMVFFAGLGLGIGSGKDKAGDLTSSSSSTQFGLNLGIRYFVDSNVALTGEFSYDTGSKKIQDVDDPVKFSSIHVMNIGFSLFL
jgi:opacity protein-like surface antigen